MTERRVVIREGTLKKNTNPPPVGPRPLPPKAQFAVRKIPVANDGEQLLRFQFESMGLTKFHEQYHFAESLGRKFAADFCFVAADVGLIGCTGLIVEVNGGIFMKGGAHSMPTKIIGDMERQQYATRLGYFMMAFQPDDVFSGHAVEWTRVTLVERGWKP